MSFVGVVGRCIWWESLKRTLESLVKRSQARSSFSGSIAEERDADPGTREVRGGFLKKLALGIGLLHSRLL